MTSSESLLVWIEDGLKSIDCRAYGPKGRYEHDAYWMKDQVLDLLQEARKAFPDSVVSDKLDTSGITNEEFDRSLLQMESCVGDGSGASLPLIDGEWRDIKTAPKDGTEVIGVHFRERDDFEPALYGPWTIAFDRGKWRSSWDGLEVVNYMSDFGTEYKEPDCDPTHWRPMPAAPITAVVTSAEPATPMEDSVTVAQWSVK